MAKLTKQQQIEIAEECQGLLLQHYLERLKDGTISDTGAANLQRLLSGNGWTINPADLPQDLKNKLIPVEPTKFEDDDPDVVGRIAVNE